MRRRQFIAGLGGGMAAWPLAVHAQQHVPVIGFLEPTTPETFADLLRGLRQGLKESGYVDGENVVIEYRWAENQVDRLPELASGLVRRGVAVIVTGGGAVAAAAAKQASATIPVVFISAEDPVKLGLVASIARPGGHLTGINFFNTELAGKRLELLLELVPAASRVAVLVNPAGPGAETTLNDIEATARVRSLQIQILRAGSSSEIDAAFATFAHQRPDALFVSPEPFFRSRRVQITHLATRHAIPATYALRDYPEAGGLMSYGASLMDAYRQAGAYSGRILKGVKPADLPVVQATKFELVINAQTARTLGLAVPPALLARADEVIE